MQYPFLLSTPPSNQTRDLPLHLILLYLYLYLYRSIQWPYVFLYMQLLHYEQPFQDMQPAAEEKKKEKQKMEMQSCRTREGQSHEGRKKMWKLLLKKKKIEMKNIQVQWSEWQIETLVLPGEVWLVAERGWDSMVHSIVEIDE